MSPSSWGLALLFPSTHVRRRGWYQIGFSNLHRGPCRFFSNRPWRMAFARVILDERWLPGGWSSHRWWISLMQQIKHWYGWVYISECGHSGVRPVPYSCLARWPGGVWWQLEKDSLAFRVWSYGTVHAPWHHDTKTNSSCFTSNSNTDEGRIPSVLTEQSHIERTNVSMWLNNHNAFRLESTTVGFRSKNIMHWLYNLF